MSVNVKCEFPYGTRIRDVATVAAALLGHKPRHVAVPGSKSTFAHTKGWSVNASSDPTLAYIGLDTTTDNPAAKLIRESDGDRYNLLYHFEGNDGHPLISPKCTAAKIALCAGLVKFFGGTVDFNDGDDKKVNMRVKAKTDVRASDDPEWSLFQQRILAVQPITAEEISKYKKFASYQIV
jgi:hypothetical protein